MVDAGGDQSGELFPVEALVASAGQENDRPVEGPDGGHRSLWSGGDRVVIPGDVANLPDQLQPVSLALIG